MNQTDNHSIVTGVSDLFTKLYTFTLSLYAFENILGLIVLVFVMSICCVCFTEYEVFSYLKQPASTPDQKKS